MLFRSALDRRHSPAESGLTGSVRCSARSRRRHPSTSAPAARKTRRRATRRPAAHRALAGLPRDPRSKPPRIRASSQGSPASARLRASRRPPHHNRCPPSADGSRASRFETKGNAAPEAGSRPASRGGESVGCPGFDGPHEQGCQRQDLRVICRLTHRDQSTQDQFVTLDAHLIQTQSPTVDDTRDLAKASAGQGQQVGSPGNRCGCRVPIQQRQRVVNRRRPRVLVKNRLV